MQEEWTKLCDMLAARLNQTGMHHAAHLCYICAGNVDHTVSYWGRQCQGGGAGAGIDVLQVGACCSPRGGGMWLPASFEWLPLTSGFFM